jgi:hypothetical protein
MFLQKTKWNTKVKYDWRTSDNEWVVFRHTMHRNTTSKVVNEFPGSFHKDAVAYMTEV